MLNEIKMIDCSNLTEKHTVFITLDYGNLTQAERFNYAQKTIDEIGSLVSPAKLVVFPKGTDIKIILNE